MIDNDSVMEHLLSQKKSAILKRWLHLIMNSYPVDTSMFLKQENDRFVNPVGYTISREIEVIYDELLGERHPDKFFASLDNIIFSPQFHYKPIIRC